MTLAEDWAALPQISDVRASADGRMAFWVWAGFAEAAQLYCAPCDGSLPPRQLTFEAGHVSIRDVSADGSRLILAQSVNACEHDHLLLMEVATGALTRLTPVQRDHYLYGGTFTADGAAVIFIADFDYDAGEVTAGGWVWRQDLETGARTCLARSETPFEAELKPSPSGALLLWHRHERAPAGTQLWVMAADGSACREVLNLGPANNAQGDWLDEGRIGFVADVEGADRLGVLTLATGAITWLAGEPDLFPFQVLPGSQKLACICHDHSRTFAEIFDAEGHHALPNLSTRRSLLPHAALPDGGWLAEAYDASAPHQLVRVFPDGRCLTLAEAAASARTYTAPRDYRWTAPDGRPMQGWLYRPEGPSRGFICYVHGGPTWHSEDWVNPKIGFWVQRGFTVLDPNYRGSTGFGYAHREAVKEDGWGGREQADIRAGIEQALADGHATKGKIAVAGNSYGGFSSWFAITRHADLVDAAIPMCGMYRLDIDYHQTEMPHGRAYSEEMMGGTPEEFPEKYANASPGNFIHDINGSLMIVHGLADSNVGPENTHVAVRELTAAGIPFEVILYEDEGHGVFRRSNVADYLARSERFLARAFGETA
jgi:dienelactone hydrolase